MSTTEVLQALAVTAELTGTELSAAAARVMTSDLQGFEPNQILGALKRIRMDGVRLTVGNIVTRLDDGRPGVEEAWALLPHGEAGSAVMTDEMASAMGVCMPLLIEGDTIAARMAFKEAYTAAVALAREERRPAKWFPSLGRDPHQRESALIEAVRKKRLPVAHAIRLLPPDRVLPAFEAMGVSDHPMLTSDHSQVAKITHMIGGLNATKPI